ncbi:hypoxia inducible factor 1 subunit alpha, like 2 isoform X3 [Esox lucius]|uniref:hypoxia inducible factor 1 subunit alpha, like 2 isoform X3 n=1 Tax=Esox lucius TaxID=8010 RepID=UPI000577AAD9|nr:hypoxia inducible factor 1 subunit alpha, like 2 isoform X3 [Esox lucius]
MTVHSSRTWTGGKQILHRCLCQDLLNCYLFGLLMTTFQEVLLHMIIPGTTDMVLFDPEPSMVRRGSSLQRYCDRKLHRTERNRINGQKRSRVSSERLRAQSRVAAKSRRERESRLFGELAAWLPLPPGLTVHMDKASIVRFTLGYLRLRAALDQRDYSAPETRVSSDTAQFSVHDCQPMDEQFSEEMVLDSALGGFMVLVSENGQIIYATGDIHTHTGLNQMDVIGRSLFDFTHLCDQKEVRDIFSKNLAPNGIQKYDFLLRMKSSLTSQGRAVNQRHTNWKAIHCTGVKKKCPLPETACLVLLCRPLPISQNMARDASLNHRTFLTRHSPDMRFTHCQSGVKELTGYTESELQGQSVYQYYHASDCQNIYKTHQNLLSKGQASLSRYRLLLKAGGYVWAETDASVVYNQIGEAQSIVCLNYILSEAELPEMTFSLQQTEALLRPFYSELEVGPTVQNEPTADDHVHLINTTESPPEHQDKIQTYLELKQQNQMNTNSLSELCELDLDSLAPYIPMDGEDFLLTPVINGILDMSEGKPPNNVHVIPPGLEDHSSKVQTVAPDFPPQLQMNNVQMKARCDSERTHTVKESEFGDCTQSVYRRGCSGFNEGNDHDRWEDLVLTECGSDKYYASCRHPRGFVAAARLPQRPVKCFPLHRPDGSTYLCRPPPSLPVLSQVDCEGILGPTSCLLQGSEITSVLDQAALRFSHLKMVAINQLTTKHAHMYTPRPVTKINCGTSTLYAEWIT